ncbi:Leucyl-tRNA synthetase, mitochondrial, partial [Coemansia nantahalensis]
MLASHDRRRLAHSTMHSLGQRSSPGARLIATGCSNSRQPEFAQWIDASTGKLDSAALEAKWRARWAEATAPGVRTPGGSRLTAEAVDRLLYTLARLQPSADAGRQITAAAAGAGRAKTAVIHCPSCGPVAVPEADLPVALPRGAALSGRGGSPLLRVPGWLNCKCLACGGAATRGTDTLDRFVDASWYFLRYTDAHNARHPFGPVRVSAAMPVDLYVGGVEHAIAHLFF